MKKFLLLVLFVSAIFPLSSFAYPGCRGTDMIIGGQMWASCNALSYKKGSDEKTGWFSAGDKFSTFLSYNGIGSRLEFQKKQYQKDPRNGPCAKGYRIPTRGDWELAIYYARLNNTPTAALLGLPYNGGYRTFKDTDGDITVEARTDVLGAYWSSTYDNIWGERAVVLHLGSLRSGTRGDGTDGVYNEGSYKWQYGENGLELVGGEETEMANVRCIRN